MAAFVTIPCTLDITSEIRVDQSVLDAVEKELADAESDFESHKRVYASFRRIFRELISNKDNLGCLIFSLESNSQIETDQSKVFRRSYLDLFGSTYESSNFSETSCQSPLATINPESFQCDRVDSPLCQAALGLSEAINGLRNVAQRLKGIKEQNLTPDITEKAALLLEDEALQRNTTP